MKFSVIDVLCSFTYHFVSMPQASLVAATFDFLYIVNHLYCDRSEQVDCVQHFLEIYGLSNVHKTWANLTLQLINLFCGSKLESKSNF